MQRRDFLKYFGVGASVVPLIGGLPQSDVVAKLIEEPKADIQIVSRMPHFEALEMFASLDKLDMHVSFISPHGRRVSFRAHTFIKKWSVGTYPIRRFGSPYTEFSPEYSELSWELEGQIIGTPEAYA